MPRLTTAVEAYFADLRRIHASGGATGERSSYPPLANLLNAVGATLKPKVFCVSELADQGAGHPDFGLYSAKQVQRGRPRPGQLPERGVVEVKGDGDDTWLVAASDQVSRYRERYGVVLVTNARDFVLLDADGAGRAVRLETFSLASSGEDFEKRLRTPRKFASDAGASFGEFLCRMLSHRARLAEPKDLAWLLASYARDALARVEAAQTGGLPELQALRQALEDALGVRFEGERGGRFFRSTLVQTLFYGIFSAWVLWAQQTPTPQEAFRWREAVWHLRAPILRALFGQLADPGHLQRLDLVQVLDWTASALDRVDREAFFARFTLGEAVPYFYEPFLQAFDPDLRKQLGVWYTPVEVVRYMVARVDRALKEDLGIADGLAADNVYVLDPCCGTGAYPAEVLRRIDGNLASRGIGALAGARLRRAATERVFGFEIMPAPFAVAHLQVGLTLQNLGAPLADDERAGVYLTNALTGWESHATKPLPFPELAEERDRAERVKQDAPILVILGNPPYNGFAGVAVDEERALSDAYRVAKNVRQPEGRGLNDLYVRFFRMAERRITERSRQGVVCFISNYSWLDGLSFTGMRERFLDAFDAIRIDCLNGDKYKTGKIAPDGSPDPSIFSTPGQPVGIQVGTAITTLVRRAEHSKVQAVGFRHLWGTRKHTELAKTAEMSPTTIYHAINPVHALGLPLAPMAVSSDWTNWPSLTELFPTKFHGALTNRDSFLVDTDLDALKARINDYFDPSLNHDEIRLRYPAAMKTTARFNAHSGRHDLLRRGGPIQSGFVRLTYRPFDVRWLYWEADTKLLDEKRADYKPHVSDANVWLSAAQHLRKGAQEPQACFTRHLGSHHLIERGANMFPAWLRDENLGTDQGRRPNLSAAAQRYLDRLGLDVEDLFHHTLAMLHDADYLNANADALRMEWPRIPLPGWPDGNAAHATDSLAESADRGRKLAALLDSDTPVAGVTQGDLRPELATIAVPATADGHAMSGNDFAVTAGWGRFGQGGAVMPGAGRAVERIVGTSGDTTFDIHLNDRTYWRNVPAAVWRYRLGGYQVLKKWLSYRERPVLGRPLTADEVQHFTDTARRIAAIIELTATAVQD